MSPGCHLRPAILETGGCAAMRVLVTEDDEILARTVADGLRQEGMARLEHGELSVDPARRVAVRAGRRLPLTRKELAVLECLLAAQGRPVSAEELLERVWDEAADPFTTTVKATINRLRAKLGDPPMIQTVRESGYYI